MLLLRSMVALNASKDIYYRYTVLATKGLIVTCMFMCMLLMSLIDGLRCR